MFLDVIVDPNGNFVLPRVKAGLVVNGPNFSEIFKNLGIEIGATYQVTNQRIEDADVVLYFDKEYSTPDANYYGIGCRAVRFCTVELTNYFGYVPRAIYLKKTRKATLVREVKLKGSILTHVSEGGVIYVSLTMLTLGVPQEKVIKVSAYPHELKAFYWPYNSLNHLTREHGYSRMPGDSDNVTYKDKEGNYITFCEYGLRKFFGFAPQDIYWKEVDA